MRTSTKRANGNGSMSTTLEPGIVLGEGTVAKPIPWMRIGLIFAAVAVAVWFGGHWYVYDRLRVTTDDAYVDTDQVMAMSRLSERVAAVLVDANQPVKRGQLLVRLDDSAERARLMLALENQRSLQASAVAAQRTADLENELQHAQMSSGSGTIVAARETTAMTASQAEEAATAVAVAQATIDAAQVDVRTADAAVPAAKNALSKAQSDLQRNTDLARQGYVSAASIDAAQTAVAQAQAAYDAAVAQSAAARAKVRTAEAALVQAKAGASAAHAAIGAAEAQLPIARGKLQESAAPSRVLDKQALASAALANASANDAQVRLAQIDLDATRITAPVDGWVSARNVEPGQTVAPGQALVTISPANRIFVTANYKETQLASIHAGSQVEITVDACRGHTFHGQVMGLGPVAQSALSTLPTLTAPSNFVKVAQRVPVRISLPHSDASCVFRPGMSVETAVVTH